MLYKVLYSLRRYKKILLFYVIPNYKFIIKNSFDISRKISINQYIKTRGLGKIIIHDNCTFGYEPGGFHRNGSIELQARTKSSLITIGKGVSTNNNIFICSSGKITIGSETLIGQGVTIMDFEAHGISPENRRKTGEIGEIIIGKNVWIGNNVIILKNTVIGDNCIVAAGAVVRGNYPQNVILGGVPATIIKKIN